MKIVKIFENGKSQALRLPKAYRLKERETYITKVRGCHNFIVVHFL